MVNKGSERDETNKEKHEHHSYNYLMQFDQTKLQLTKTMETNMRLNDCDKSDEKMR